jgi:putative transposase
MAYERHHYLDQGQKQGLSRAINANGEGMDLLVQTRQNANAAKRVFKRLPAKWGEARMAIIDTLRIDTKIILGPARAADHRAPKGGGNALKVAQQRSCKPEEMSERFKSHSQTQRFLSVRAQIHQSLYPFWCNAPNFCYN